MSKQPEVMIMRYNMIGAPHWYVTSDNRLVKQRKFLHIEDAKEYAESITTKENIVIFDGRIDD